MHTMRLGNLSPSPYSGWLRATTDFVPVGRNFKIGNHLVVVGRPWGMARHLVDIRTTLAPGQEVVLDWDAAVEHPFQLQPPPGGPIAFFGGEAKLDGIPMTWVSLRADGAGYTARLRGRTGRMFCVELWVTWFPDQPYLATGEAVVTCSNPNVPDWTSSVLPNQLRLEFGDGLVVCPMGRVGSLEAAGSTFADGQSRVVPLTIVWPRHTQGAQDWASVAARLSGGLCAVGINKLWAGGNPTYPAGFSARSWASPKLGEAARRISTWEPAVCGPAPTSGVTGAQEDQCFVRGEALLPGGLGADLVTYLSAIKVAARPCHHLEADGSQVDVERHQSPRLVLWDSRVHFSAVVSPDRLGKTGYLEPSLTNGWGGADVEHWFHNTLAAACTMTASNACQWLLEMQARIYMLQHTTAQGLANSDTFASRAVGWEALMATHLWRCLEDRALAQRVKDHFRRRVDLVIFPKLSGKAIWDIRRDDPRLGAGDWWIPWQQSVGAYFLDVALWEVLGLSAALSPERQMCRVAAQKVLDDAWVQGASFGDGVDSEEWLRYEQYVEDELGDAVDALRAECVSESDLVTWTTRAIAPVNGGGVSDASFNWFGMALAPAAVLRHDPMSAKALSIWASLRNPTTTAQASWLAPGVIA